MDILPCITAPLTILAGGLLFLSRYHRKLAEMNLATAEENERLAKDLRYKADLNNFVASTLYGVEARQN